MRLQHFRPALRSSTGDGPRSFEFTLCLKPIFTIKTVRTAARDVDLIGALSDVACRHDDERWRNSVVDHNKHPLADRRYGCRTDFRERVALPIQDRLCKR